MTRTITHHAAVSVTWAKLSPEVYDLTTAVLVSLNDGPNNTSRLEITCVTQKQYLSRQAEVLNLLNHRNRERAFSRSLDYDGNVWLEYIGIYPTLAEWPQETFDTLFGGVLMQFQEDYLSLEELPALQA